MEKEKSCNRCKHLEYCGMQGNITAEECKEYSEVKSKIFHLTWQEIERRQQKNDR